MGMHVGINYPWLHCGWDFGDPPLAWIGTNTPEEWRDKKRQQIEEDFCRFTSQGIFAVRWFLLADGTNYGMGTFAPRKTGRRWTFAPLPPDHSFYESLCRDFEFVLQVCLKNKIKLLPSLIDFSWCHEGVSLGNNSGIVKGGRYDIIRDPSKRDALFDRVLDPLLDVSIKHPASIYAWELINEPEWVIRRFRNFRIPNGKRMVAFREMQNFISEGVRRINSKRLIDGSPAFPSTVGFAHWESLHRWNAERLGIRLHQFHYYAQNNRPLPQCSNLSRHPCIVGEFATAAQKEWPDLQSLRRDQTIGNRLSCIEEKGYPACFMWSARAMDPATKWTKEAHRELLDYNHRNGPNGVPA